MNDILKGGLIAFGTVALVSGLLLILGKKPEQISTSGNFTVATTPVTIDGCQYFMVKVSSADKEYMSLIHKGNCTNHVLLKSEQ